MLSSNICRSLPVLKKAKSPLSLSVRLSSQNNDKKPSQAHFNDQQATYYTAKDIEFCPNRAREVMQNHVLEASQSSHNDDPFVEGKKVTPAAPMSDQDHLDAYKSGSSVSLHSVMQSNVPEPFATSGKAPTHLNMPGGSSSQGYKYLSGQMQKTHQSKQ